MPNLNTHKNKHLTLEERLEIQDCLNHGMTFKAIGKPIEKDQTTVSKEVKRHLTLMGHPVQKLDKNGNLLEPVVCPRLLKSPYVCNPCKQRQFRCPFQKQLYYAKHAQKEYEQLLVEARTGIPLNKEEFYEVDHIISDGIHRGQHLYHIMQTNDLPVSKSTIYRHLKQGYLSVSAIDFPRVVKFKSRKQKPSDYIPRSAKIGRTYEDFLNFTSINNLSSWVEMDTVIGRIVGKAILTLGFTFCNFMVGFLLENKSSDDVTDKISRLKSCFSSHIIRFSDIFPLILTDDGGEFANVFAFENNANGEKENRLFFCDPFRSNQKPKVEKNHTLFRDIVPQGKSFDHFTQETINLIFSHVNRVKRKSLNGKSPFEVFTFTYGNLLADLFGIKSIPANEVIQSPKLLYN